MIGVGGEGEAADRVAAAIEAAGLDATRLSAGERPAATLDAVAAVGEGALVDRFDPDLAGPVLPVGDLDGFPSVPADDAAGVLEAFLDGRAATRSNPLLAVEADGEPLGAAGLDVTLVRSEPGRISEFSVAGDEARARFRADGVVAATPAGSRGYARAAGGPRLELDSGVVAVVAVAAFGLGAPTWVLEPAGGISLRVERDEGDVSLLLDGRERRRLTGSSTVAVTPGGTVETVVPPD